MQDDEAFSQIMEYFKLPPSTDLNEDELQKLLEEMIKDGYIYIKYNTGYNDTRYRTHHNKSGINNRGLFFSRHTCPD